MELVEFYLKNRKFRPFPISSESFFSDLIITTDKAIKTKQNCRKRLTE